MFGNMIMIYVKNSKGLFTDRTKASLRCEHPIVILQRNSITLQVVFSSELHRGGNFPVWASFIHITGTTLIVCFMGSLWVTRRLSFGFPSRFALQLLQWFSL